MRLQGAQVGLALSGSHHTLGQALEQIELLRSEGAVVQPIVSQTILTVETKYGSPNHWLKKIEAAAGRRPLISIPEVEPLGPNRSLDILAVIPCTGNTLAKIANAMTDSTVTMAVKSQLRNGRPVLLSISTNDALGLNAKNLGLLLATKNVYFVPFGQDNPEEKPTSMVSHPELLLPAMLAALEHRQIQPLLQSWSSK